MRFGCSKSCLCVAAGLHCPALLISIVLTTERPGSFTDRELDFALENFPGAAIGGYSRGTVGGEGWCVLVDGESAMKGAGRQERL